MIHAQDINTVGVVQADGTIKYYGNAAILAGAKIVSYAKNIHFSTILASLQEVRKSLSFDALPEVTGLISDFAMDAAVACAVLLQSADNNQDVAESMFKVANAHNQRNIRTFVSSRSGIASNTAILFPNDSAEDSDAIRKAVREFMRDNS